MSKKAKHSVKESEALEAVEGKNIGMALVQTEPPKSLAEWADRIKAQKGTTAEFAGLISEELGIEKSEAEALISRHEIAVVGPRSPYFAGFFVGEGDDLDFGRYKAKTLRFIGLGSERVQLISSYSLQRWAQASERRAGDLLCTSFQGYQMLATGNHVKELMLTSMGANFVSSQVEAAIAAKRSIGVFSGYADALAWAKELMS